MKDFSEDFKEGTICDFEKFEAHKPFGTKERITLALLISKVSSGMT
tara:strand:- start:337 stop:474 length:138 start_codon:yes stop_codon:yes gene_type:complete